MVNSGLAVTVRVTLAVSTVEPLVPVTVMVAAPTVAVLVAVNVSVLPPDPVTDVGLKLAVTPVGRPLTVKATALLKPLNAPMVTLLPTLVPCMTVVAVAETVKPADVVGGSAGYAFCTSSRNSVSQKVPAGGEFGIEFDRSRRCQRIGIAPDRSSDRRQLKLRRCIRCQDSCRPILPEA